MHIASRDNTVGIRAPEFVGGGSDWINSEPLKMGDLRGRVVLVDFWDYTCVNCLRTLPYVKQWQERYKDKGLIVVGIHTPEFSFARSTATLKDAAERLGIKYPVLNDSDYENWRAYANRYWPRKYLVGPDGRIIYDHSGEGAYGDTEEAIQKALLQIEPEAKLPAVMEPVRGVDQPGAVCYPMTPELYAGYQRGMLGSPEGYNPDKVVEFTDPGVHADGRVYAQGPFFNDAESLRHARKTENLEDYISIVYHALEVNAVMRPGRGQYELVVTQDGRPVAAEDAGEDTYMADGRSLITVDQPRMYRIIENKTFGSHELRLASDSDSFAVYAFTFGSCEEPD